MYNIIKLATALICILFSTNSFCTDSTNSTIRKDVLVIKTRSKLQWYQPEILLRGSAESYFDMPTSCPRGAGNVNCNFVRMSDSGCPISALTLRSWINDNNLRRVFLKAEVRRLWEYACHLSNLEFIVACSLICQA